MTDMNHPNSSRCRGRLPTTLSTDLASGRAVELAELYALDAVSHAERAAIEEYVSAAPEAERDAFNERVRQARETLAATFTAEEEPPADLFGRIVAQLPAQPGMPRRTRHEAPAAAAARRPMNSPPPANAVKNDAGPRGCATGWSALPPPPSSRWAAWASAPTWPTRTIR